MNIYDALKKDHETVKQLLNQLVQLEPDQAGARHSLIAQIRDELIPHARAEEAVFYNSLRSIAPVNDMAMHGYQEHFEAETALRLLQVRDKIDLEWKDTARKLKKAVEHHIEEEENKIFSAAKQLFTNDEAKMMGEAFLALKPQIKEEGVLKTTLEMIVNMMPPQFAPRFRSYNLESRL